MKSSDAFPSKYARADDLKGRDLELTMKVVIMEELEDRDGEKMNKPVLYFQGATKGLVLNRTNWDRIALQHGDDSEKWPGKKIVLGTEIVTAFGETKPALRVRVPLPKAANGEESGL